MGNQNILKQIPEDQSWVVQMLINVIKENGEFNPYA